jgi:pyridoxine 5-phosphate synthase
MVRLSVNVNKVALLRNARGGSIPSLLDFVRKAVDYGAQGITVHPRPDGRHVLYSDVKFIKRIIDVEFNVEGNPNEDFIALMLEVKPNQCTLVPDSVEQLTSNHGWDTIHNVEFLKWEVGRLKAAGIRVSIFVDPKPEMVEGAAQVGADRVELFTGPYAHGFADDPEAAIAPYVECAKVADRLNLGLNAGHDLNLQNLPLLKKRLPNLLEVSIGHALICDALYMGLEKTIKEYLHILRK